MNRDDARDREVQALRERLSRLGEASLRINESLESHTVPKAVAESARALADALSGWATPRRNIDACGPLPLRLFLLDYCRFMSAA